MYDPALSFWSINSTGLLHPSCRPLWPPRISSAALAERLLWLGVEVRGWWDLLLMLWCVVNTFNYCCHCSWWLNGLPMGVPLGFMISETNGGPFDIYYHESPMLMSTYTHFIIRILWMSKFVHQCQCLPLRHVVQQPVEICWARLTEVIAEATAGDHSRLQSSIDNHSSHDWPHLCCAPLLKSVQTLQTFQTFSDCWWLLSWNISGHYLVLYCVYRHVTM